MIQICTSCQTEQVTYRSSLGFERVYLPLTWQIHPFKSRGTICLNHYVLFTLYTVVYIIMAHDTAFSKADVILWFSMLYVSISWQWIIALRYIPPPPPPCNIHYYWYCLIKYESHLGALLVHKHLFAATVFPLSAHIFLITIKLSPSFSKNIN